ncbi:NACHT domain-containing protein [bacterium]|nr:NACHT domain-containing protein [bacterium]NCT22084.1 NACHT domain-containing protein [bacterium]OIO83805.1 MAG: hypothetical protein AUK01_11545 [Anaerolineae bacterium CG2_30_57_67]
MNRLPGLDTLSFWIGAIVSSILWGIMLALRPMFTAALETWRKQREEARLRADSGIEDSHRRVLYRQTQEMHLAASLFALDEIMEIPCLLAPPPQLEPGMPSQHEDVVARAIPYLRDWPELAAFYGAETLTLAEALSGDANLLITGQPGSGKSTALAILTAQITNRAPEVAALQERVPFLIHVADLGLPHPEPKKPEDLLQALIEAESNRASLFDRPRLPAFTQISFQAGRALLLLDGLDELPQAQIQEATAWLKLLLRAYPKTRVVASAAPEYADGLTSLQFVPLALVPWSAEQQNHFLHKWDALWQQYVSREAWAQTGEQIEPTLLRRWLSAENTLGLTPLEYTLKLWAAYAGDTRGPRPADAIEAHLRRLTPLNTPPEALQALGAQISLNGLALFDEKNAKDWIKKFEPSLAAEAETSPAPEPPTDGDPLPASTDAPVPTGVPQKTAASASAQPSLLSALVQYGLLTVHPQNRLRFVHPVFSGWLAGRALTANSAESLLAQPAWSGQTLTLRYLAAYNDPTPLLRTLAAQADPLLLRPSLLSGRLLRDAPPQAPWRGLVMATLLQILQNEEQPMSIRGQALAALILSGDPNSGALFRQLLQAPSLELRRLAALGAGMTHENKAVEGLTRLLGQSMGATQQAACLALVAIGTPAALEAVATGLLRGDEDLRQAAAESLANDRAEGHEALRDGISSEDIIMRRAVVYGLGRIREPWADQILERIQTEDNQWVVRTAAVELVSARAQLNPRVPRRLMAPAETPWLIEFAGRHGMGVTPGQPATDLLLLAIKGEDDIERQAALRYLRLTPNEGVIAAFYQIYFGQDLDLRQEITYALTDFAYAGITLPDPHQFGLG